MNKVTSRHARPGAGRAAATPETEDEMKSAVVGAEQMPLVGKNATWVVRTADCRKAPAALEKRGVKFVSQPRKTAWGISAVFVGLYGNPHNLPEPVKGA